MPKCKACGNDIAFLKTPKGKFMPVNGLEVERYYLHLHGKGEPQVDIVVDTGEVIRGRIGKASDNGVTMVKGRESHFSTCPQADKFRR